MSVQKSWQAVGDVLFQQQIALWRTYYAAMRALRDLKKAALNSITDSTMTQLMPEYLATHAQWIKLLQELLSCRDDTVQDELFKDAQILFRHMQRQKWEGE